MNITDLDKDTLFDVRTIKRSMGQGRISEETLQTHLDALEDCASYADHTTTRMVTGMGRALDEP